MASEVEVEQMSQMQDSTGDGQIGKWQAADTSPQLPRPLTCKEDSKQAAISSKTEEEGKSPCCAARTQAAAKRSRPALARLLDGYKQRTAPRKQTEISSNKAAATRTPHTAHQQCTHMEAERSSARTQQPLQRQACKSSVRSPLPLAMARLDGGSLDGAAAPPPPGSNLSRSRAWARRGSGIRAASRSLGAAGHAASAVKPGVTSNC